MKVAPYSQILPLKFTADNNPRDKKSDNIASDSKAIETSMQDIQSIYGKAFVNIQANSVLFNKTVFNLSGLLAALSDEEFNNIKINQTYEKDDFITKILSITENLSEKERQNVCCYFGFELYQNEENPTGFSILGYPANPKDKSLLMEVKDLKAKETISRLQPEVKRFLENNPVICSNKDIEKELNKIIKVFPELRVLIGKKQHRNHDFDVMKHSLKVMQKIVQNPEFEKLNESDKKLMLTASLFHDIRKAEGKRDPQHALNGALDTRYITKKLNLTPDEEAKLYSLIKNHGWLNFVNRTKTQNEEQEAQKIAAFDMRQGNLFEMMKIFTYADLKSTKNSDASYNKHKEKFEAHSNKISGYIDRLQKFSQILN